VTEKKTERFELLKNIMLICTAVQHTKNMSEYKVLYSNEYTMIVNYF